MRLATTVSTVETSGLAEATNFSIKVTGKAFKILLDGLYADKVAAVIRELSTNAYDAHLAIGKGDEPFDVQLPTLFDPTFRVRDYGVSMTHEDTMRLMSTVFDSSKDATNTMVGAFGLGSKSPFSLVDTFSLNVIKDGERRVYSAFIGPDGVPALALLGREPTTEPQGVEFSMTIDPKDVRAFKERAIRILKWFPTHPNVYEGSAKLTLPTMDALVEGKGWKLLKEVVSTYGATRVTAMARQGCVVYPLNASAIPNLSEQHRALMDAPLVVDFPIGSLDVAASREALSYDPQTCANIVARLNLVSKEIMDHYGKAIKDAPTLWDAGKKRMEVMSGSGLPRALLGVLGQTKWQDKVVPDSFSMLAIRMKLRDDHQIEFTPYFWDSWRATRSSQAVYIDHTSESSGRNMRWEYGAALTIYFTLADARPTYEGRRIREAHKGGSILLFVLAKEEDHRLILDAMGSPPEFKWTKDLPAPNIPKRASPAPKRGTTKKEEVKARSIVKDSDGSYKIGGEKVVPLDGDAYYAVTREGKVRDLGSAKDKSAEYETFLGGIKFVEPLGYLPKEPIYLVSSIYQKRVEAFIEGGGKWQRIDDHIRAAATNFADKLFEEAEVYNIAGQLQRCNWATLLRNDGRFRKLIERLKTGPLYALHQVIIDQGFDNTQAGVIQRADNYTRAVWPICVFGIDGPAANHGASARLKKSAKLGALTGASEACNLAYPLVRGYDSTRTYGAPNAEHVIQYIEAIDMLRASKAAIAANANAVAAAAA